MSQVETAEGKSEGESELIAWLRDNDLMDAKDKLLNMRRRITLDYLKEFDPMFLNGFIKSDLKLDGMLAYDFSKAVAKLRESSGSTPPKQIVRIVLSKEEDDAITVLNEKCTSVAVYIDKLTKDIDGLSIVSRDIEEKITQFEQKSIKQIKSRMNELRKQSNVEINQKKEQISNHIQKVEAYKLLVNEAQMKQNALLTDDKLDKSKRKTKILEINKNVLNENDIMQNKLNCTALVTATFDERNFFKHISNVGYITNYNYPKPPIMVVKTVTTCEATVEFEEVKSELECCIEISNTDEDEKGDWNEMAKIKNQNTYKVTNLQADKSYKVRSKYKNQCGWSKYSQVVSFTTKILNKYSAYQDLQCWQCSENENGKMAICNNIYNPNRNDWYGRDGYSALCPTHANRVGTDDSYKSLAM